MKRQVWFIPLADERWVCRRNWDPLRTRATPERHRGVFTTRRYTNPRLPLGPTLPCAVCQFLYILPWFGSRFIIIIIERKDLGGVMSKDCKDTFQTLKTVTKRECDAKWEQCMCQMRSWAELSRSGKLRLNSSVFNWRLKDASEGNDMRDLDRLFHVRAAATGKAGHWR